jgi:hypothetical protein
MLGLYCLGFCLVLIIKVLAMQNTTQRKFTHILLLSPVIAYVAITMKIIIPIKTFLAQNLQSLIGG